MKSEFILHHTQGKEVDRLGGKDISEKILEGYNDVFSDIVNVLLFDGKEVLLPDELEDQAPHSYSITDG